MLTIDEFIDLANDAFSEIPEPVTERLNGGVIVQEYSKLHPESLPENPLYIMGEYVHDPLGLGRYILLYYGSFAAARQLENPERAFLEISAVIKHEFVHHLENLAGERDLEIEDEEDLEEYKSRASEQSE